MKRVEIRVAGQLFVVAERETTEELREAIRQGAKGFYLWPEERETLQHELAVAVAQSMERQWEGS